MSLTRIRIFDILNYLLLAVFVVICVYPFYYVLIYSISNPSKVAQGIFLLPAGLDLTTYKSILQLPYILNSFFVSTARTVIGTVLTIM